MGLYRINNVIDSFSEQVFLYEQDILNEAETKKYEEYGLYHYTRGGHIINKYETDSKSNKYAIEQHRSLVPFDLDNPLGFTKEKDKIRSDLAKLANEAKGDHPKTWFVQKIAWLRSLYTKVLVKLNKWSGEKTTGILTSVRQGMAVVARTILQLIDRLMAKVQSMVDESIFIYDTSLIPVLEQCHYFDAEYGIDILFEEEEFKGYSKITDEEIKEDIRKLMFLPKEEREKEKKRIKQKQEQFEKYLDEQHSKKKSIEEEHKKQQHEMEEKREKERQEKLEKFKKESQERLEKRKKEWAESDRKFEEHMAKERPKIHKWAEKTSKWDNLIHNSKGYGNLHYHNGLVGTNFYQSSKENPKERHADYNLTRIDSEDESGNGDNTQIEKNKKELEEILHNNEGKPKSWLAKKIDWLRSLYKKVLFKLHKPMEYKDPDKVTIWDKIKKGLKNFAKLILTTIDKLAYKLQNFVDSK